MYPDLYSLIHDVIGIEMPYLMYVKTFGYFLSLAIISTFILFYLDVKRNERVGIIKIVLLNRKNFMPSEKLPFVVLITIISALLGGKFFDILENFQKITWDNYFTIIAKSGYAYYGGLILGFVGGWLTCLRLNLPFSRLLDSLSPYLMLGYAVGRMGCHLSGDGDWGIPNPMAVPNWWFLPHFLWAYDYPNNAIESGFLIENCSGKYCYHLDPSVFPTSLYEPIIALIFSFVLYYLKPKFIEVSGIIFCFFLLFMGIERFFIEFIRINPLHKMSNILLSQAQYISILIVLISIFIMAYFLLKQKMKV